MKASKRLITLSFILSLAACSDPNPLAQKPLDESARLLFVHAGGDAYRQCMEAQYTSSACHRLYQTMRQRLKQEGLIVSEKQIADKALYKRLATRLSRLSLLED